MSSTALAHYAPDRRRRATSADVGGAAVLATLVFAAALWLANGGIATAAQPGGLALTTGRLTGLLSADLLLVQVLLMARIPFVERAWGHDVLTRRHRLVGYASFHLMLAHIVLIVVGYAQSGRTGVLPQAWDLLVNYPGMLLAAAGTLALVAVVALSVRAARRRLRYESWHLIHLYAYLGVGLALPHELWTGDDFLTSPVATAFWWSLWAAAAACIVAFRLALPVGRSLFHRLVVESVVAPAPGVVSVVMRGRRLDRLPVRPGQYLHWRFLTGPGWSRAHPFSVSAGPGGDRIRITAGTDGDDGARLAGIRPGTRVLVEGPYGGLTADRRHRRDVLLVAAGLGVSPMRSLAERIAGEPAAPGPGGVRRPSVVLLHRVNAPDDALFTAEFAALSRWGDIRAVPLVGPRGGDGSWLPVRSQSRPTAGGPHEKGPAGDPRGSDAAAVRRLVPDAVDREVYLCGPRPWMDAVARTVAALGVPPAAVHREDFTW